MVKKSLYEATVFNNYDIFSFHQYHISLPQTFIHIYAKALCLVFFYIFYSSNLWFKYSTCSKF